MRYPLEGCVANLKAMPRSDKALVMLVHGSKDPAWMQPFYELAAEVREAAPGARVEIACLQFCEPSLADRIKELYSSGVGHVLVVPMFISGLGHVLKDVPAEVGRAKEQCPGISISVSPALGELPRAREGFVRAIAELENG